jgi:hypothetical protein
MLTDDTKMTVPPPDAATCGSAYLPYEPGA